MSVRKLTDEQVDTRIILMLQMQEIMNLQFVFLTFILGYYPLLLLFFSEERTDKKHF